jgi:hypothetical protein
MSLKYLNSLSMKIILVSSVILFLFGANIFGQNLIGYKESEIRKYMAENQKDMTFQNFTNNSTFKYLKYVDSDETQTLLFFLTEQSICKSIRLVCDKNLKTEKIREYNALYKKTGENQWSETKSGKMYLIELKEEEWSINVTIKLHE